MHTIVLSMMRTVVASELFLRIDVRYFHMSIIDVEIDYKIEEDEGMLKMIDAL